MLFIYNVGMLINDFKLNLAQIVAKIFLWLHLSHKKIVVDLPAGRQVAGNRCLIDI
jgi:hypothetical protein